MPNVARRSRGKRIVVIAIVIVIAVLGVLGVGAVLKKREVRIDVQTEKIALRDITEFVTASGRIQPVTQVVINPEVSGEIVELPVREGQRVQKGDLLVRIRQDNYLASTNSADASYKSALAHQNLSRANLEKARLEHERARLLFDAGLISDSQFLEARTVLAVGEATHETSLHQVQQAKAARDRAIEDLAKTTIVAPIDGTVIKLKSSRGERVVGTAMMAGTEIMTIAALDVMEARVDVSETDVVLIEPGQKARVEVDAYRDRKFAGEVTEIANAAKTPGQGQQQEATRFEVKIRIVESEGFRPGMSVTTAIETRYRTNVLSVPIQSVTTRPPREAAGETSADGVEKPGSGDAAVSAPGGRREDERRKPVEVVFVVRESRARMVEVERGVADDRFVEISRGLSEGDDVVSGSYRAINRELEEGKPVRVDNAPKPSPRDRSSP